MKILIGFLVAGVVVTGVFMVKDLVKNTPEETKETATDRDNLETSAPLESTNPNAGKKMAFSEFIKQNTGSYKCTVDQDIDGSITAGTTYVSDGMIRGEYNTKVQNINVDTTFIVRDGFSYSFTSLAPTMGFKVKITEPKAGDTTTATSGSYSFNAEKIGDYNCEPWTLDASKFTVPTNITFKEI